MKRERYFQDELWRMFVTYAILPATLFTFICGILFYDSPAPWKRKGKQGIPFLCERTGKSNGGKL